MKVLLINPKFPDTYWSFHYALPFEGKRSAFPPLGLLTVSALLPFSWERRLVDMNVESLKASHIDWADMIFITAMLVQKDSLKQVAQLCKAKGKRVVLGGPYVTTTVEDLPDADHIFLGEGARRRRNQRRSDRRRVRRHTVVPNNAPTPAVIAIARVPHNVTRNIPFRIGAPPV